MILDRHEAENEGDNLPSEIRRQMMFDGEPDCCPHCTDCICEVELYEDLEDDVDPRWNDLGHIEDGMERSWYRNEEHP